MKKGFCAESLVDEHYFNKGYDVIDTGKISNRSGHGIDNIFIKGNEIVFVETKANTSQLYGKQHNPQKYIKTQIRAINKGINKCKGRFKVLCNNNEARKIANRISDAAISYKNIYKHATVQVGRMDKGCSGEPDIKPWTKKK